MATLDQQRAAYAWQKVADAASADIEKYEKYTNLAKAAPSLMMNSGLMQTLAFLKAKDTAEHLALLNHILKWLDIRFLTRREDTAPPDFAFVMQGLHGADSSYYMQLTSETMALLRWIRQFADARKAMG